jgi:hypothetical protein
VTSTRHNPACDKIREFLFVFRWIWFWSTEAASFPSQYDRRRQNRRGFCQLALYFNKPVLSWRVHVAVPVRMQGNFYEIGFCCKNRRGMGEGLGEPWVREC